jgi:hypothetical protein
VSAGKELPRDVPLGLLVHLDRLLRWRMKLRHCPTKQRTHLEMIRPDLTIRMTFSN